MIRALIQNIREKSSPYNEVQNLCSANKFYKRFQMKKVTGSVFSMTKRKIKIISHLSCVAKCRLLQNIDIETSAFA